MNKIKKKFCALISFVAMVVSYAADDPYKLEYNSLVIQLRNYKLIDARETVIRLSKLMKSKEQWLRVRDLLHRYPQIGHDILIIYDKTIPIPLNEVDQNLKLADSLMLKKEFKSAANKYQEVLLEIIKNKKFRVGRNYHLYLSIVHSLSRALYALKQYDDAFVLYRTLPTSYVYYNQVQFELMWNNYLNNRLEYSLGAIATMASGHFSSWLEPEVYLLQYYIYRRMCRDLDAEVVKNAARYYQKYISENKLTLGQWIKKDVETKLYEQAMRSGSNKSSEFIRMKKFLSSRMKNDIKRLKKEFELVLAHIDVDNRKTNRKLPPVQSLLTVDQLLLDSSDKWSLDDNEVFVDELGKKVFIQKDLCKK